MKKTLSTKVSFMLGSEASEHYSVTLSEDYRTITVRIYRICLEGVTGQRKNGSDILTFRGTDKLQMEILADNSNDSAILLQMTGALDTLSDVNWTGTEEGGIISVIRIPVSANQTQFLVQKKAGCGYYLMESGEEVNLVVTDTSSISYSMKIPYMPGTNLDAIRDKDDYQNNRFTITLPGDQTAYLQAVPIININNVITGIKTTLNAEGNTVITVTTSKLQAYKLNYTSSEILVEVGNPKDLFDKIVVLDAGHGGKDPGTQRNGYSEKDLNLEMIYTKMQAYFDNSDIKAYWTREDDTFIELKDRAAFASKVGADIFVSLHMNSFTTVSPNGLSVFYAKENKTATSGGLNSYGLADILQRNLVKGLGCNDRKVKSNSYVVCKSNTVPAVIIELGFMSNPGELKKLTSASYQNKAAKYIYESIVQVFQEYPTGR